MREMVGDQPRERGLRASDVRALAGAGFEIGFHTRAHYHLQTLADDALARNMREGLGELAQAAGTAIGTIAYPHAGADLRIAGAAAAAGFELGFTGNNRPTRPGDHPLLIERIDAWPCSADGFEFRLARVIAHG
jgi:peptidoglycan/xylan/chitin deacetylase (PgdA/CDA1 family)